MSSTAARTRALSRRRRSRRAPGPAVRADPPASRLCPNEPRAQTDAARCVGATGATPVKYFAIARVHHTARAFGRFCLSSFIPRLLAPSLAPRAVAADPPERLEPPHLHGAHLERLRARQRPGRPERVARGARAVEQIAVQPKRESVSPLERHGIRAPSRECVVGFFPFGVPAVPWFASPPRPTRRLRALDHGGAKTRNIARRRTAAVPSATRRS